jgi:hypothetical protein
MKKTAFSEAVTFSLLTVIKSYRQNFPGNFLRHTGEGRARIEAFQRYP